MTWRIIGSSACSINLAASRLTRSSVRWFAGLLPDWSDPISDLYQPLTHLPGLGMRFDPGAAPLCLYLWRSLPSENNTAGSEQAT